MSRLRLSLPALLLLLALPAVPGAAAQTPPEALEDPHALEAELMRGVLAWNDQTPARAHAHFQAVYEADPAFYSSGQGAAAFWLGRSYQELGEGGRAGDVWRDGFAALAEAGIFDVHLADAFIRDVFARQDRAAYPEAAQAYMFLLRFAAADFTEEEQALVRAHLEPLALVLPASVRAQTGLEGVEEGEAPGPVPAGAGEILEAWWRSRDPMPATRRNERLEEHLERVAYAERHYRPEGRFDDRARIHIRLGPPDKRTSVDFASTRFRNRVVDRSPTLSQLDFPANELWVYDGLGQHAQFLFVARDDYFRLGTTTDLLPPEVRRGVSKSERGEGRAAALVRTMEEIYRELSLFHPVYAIRYQDIADFVTQLDHQEIVQEGEQHSSMLRERARASDDGTGQNNQPTPGTMPSGPTLTSVLTRRPSEFAQNMTMRADAEDDVAVLRREETVPQAATHLLDDIELLPVDARYARFLDADGSTRTEVYWSAPADALALTGDLRERLREAGVAGTDAFVVVASYVQKDAAYRDRIVNYQRHLVDDLRAGDAETILRPQTYVLRGDTATYHLAVQWDQHAAVRQGGGIQLGPRLRMNTFRADTLAALRSEAGTLEMSDLKPVLVPAGGPPAEAATLAREADPYPHGRITTQTPLALYFEVYHLAFGPDDQTRFTVRYEVARREEGGLLQLFRDRQERTAGRAERQGTSRKAAEYILLDTSAWEGADEVVVSVRIVDEVTGQEVVRSLSFDVVDA